MRSGGSDQSVRRRTQRVLDSRFESSDCLAAWRIFSFLISPLRGSRSDETRLALLRSLFSSATIVFGSLFVVHNVFFESFHFTLKLNKANGIAESAMFPGLDHAFLAL